jgi:hypothetical protein
MPRISEDDYDIQQIQKGSELMLRIKEGLVPSIWCAINIKQYLFYFLNTCSVHCQIE